MSVPTNETKRGVIYTFYSFKGGTGRTMALANVATLLAGWGRRVLVVDWDLEAPGIERFFAGGDTAARRIRASRPGVTDLMQAHALGKELKWEDAVHHLDSGVSVISAGREDGTYIEGLQKLDFEMLFEKHGLGQYIERLRMEWIDAYEFILIDSRTGMTDIGGICTVHLPDIIVLLFTATDSSTQGALELVERARKAQERLPLERGRLIALPVPARDETRTEYERAARWKKVFAERFRDLYSDWLPTQISPLEAIEILRIPYIPYWSFGEELPVLKEGLSDPSSLSSAYEVLARLLAARLDWQEAVGERKLAPPPGSTSRAIDSGWVNKHRAVAEEGLLKAKKPGFMEAYHICLDSAVTKTQQDLLTIARQAQVHTFGWPIGVVLDREEFRPRPTNEGIVANLDTGNSYDYWTLAKNGDFYTLLSLFEDDRGESMFFFNTQIIRITEVILHCTKLYTAFGIEPRAGVELHMGYGGLKGRVLSATANRMMAKTRENVLENRVEAKVNFRVGANDSEIAAIVKQLCEPVFAIFDFAKFPDDMYDQIVKSFIEGKAT